MEDNSTLSWCCISSFWKSGESNTPINNSHINKGLNDCNVNGIIHTATIKQQYRIIPQQFYYIASVSWLSSDSFPAVLSQYSLINPLNATCTSTDRHHVFVCNRSRYFPQDLVGTKTEQKWQRFSSNTVRLHSVKKTFWYYSCDRCIPTTIFLYFF